MIPQGMDYLAFRSCSFPDGEWRVEAINFDGDGECYVSIFTGPLAQERAEEYAAWKQGLLSDQ